MLLMQALILSLSRINKHTFDGNIPVALLCVTFFSRPSEPLRTINAFVSILIVNYPISVLLSQKGASNYITDCQYFSLLNF